MLSSQWLLATITLTALAFGLTLPVGAQSTEPAEPVGRRFQVDPETGDDTADGIQQPFRTIAKAIRMAQAGDTIHLKPTIYRDYAGFYGKTGEPGRPITLDGHGAILEGADPLDPKGWTEVAPGLYRHDNLLPRFDDAMLGRWFFLFDGVPQHMGRTSKGPSALLKPPEDLKPGEWTYLKQAGQPEQPNGLLTGSFYVCLSTTQPLAAANIAIPVRSAGVQFSGDNRHLVIRNLTATHPYNDGFNIHGHCEDVLFENIQALECGDDGISAHETAEYEVRNFVSAGNSTGICDTGASRTTYDGVFIRNCLGHDLYFLDTGRYRVKNAIVLSSSSRALAVIGRQAAEPCRLTLENVLIIRSPDHPHEARITPNTVMTAKQVTFWNLDLHATGGKLTWQDSLIAGERKPRVILGRDVVWQAQANRYDLQSFRWDQTEFTSANWSDFPPKALQDQDSVWQALSPEQPPAAGQGADQKALARRFPQAKLPLSP